RSSFGGFPWPPVSGLAQVQRRQGSRNVHRPADRLCVAGRARILRDLAHRSRHHALFLALRLSRARRDARDAVGVREAARGGALRGGGGGGVGDAPGEYRAAGGRIRGENRGAVGSAAVTLAQMKRTLLALHPGAVTYLAWSPGRYVELLCYLPR